eukprot:403341835
MSTEFQRLKPKRFPKKSYKHSQETRYWKKYQNVLMEKDESLQISDISFCKGEKPYLMAAAVSARIDIYSLTQPEGDDFNDDKLKPISTMFKFKDAVHSVKLRQDGNLLLAGENSGRIQLFEIKNKFILKTYQEFTSQINSFDFKPNMKEFVAGSNESGIKYFSIQEPQSIFTIKNAHNDNIKKVQFVSDNILLSASQDKTVKLWDLRNYNTPLSTVSYQYSVEDFVTYRDNLYAVANGNIISNLYINEQTLLLKQNEFVAFQKPVMRVQYDKTRDRLLAGGLDNQLKFFQIDEKNDLKVSYKIKVPSEIFCMDISADGNHFSMGLNTGSLIIKSKLIEELDQEDEEEKLMKSFQPSFQSKSKNYKYFYRGQYVTPSLDDMIASQKQRKVKLQQYETHLKKFQYKQALLTAINQGNPEVTLALIEELIERGGLETSLSNYSENELVKILEFLADKGFDHRYQSILSEVLRIVLDMYSAVIGNFSQKVDTLVFKRLKKTIDDQIQLSSELGQLRGQIDMVLSSLQFLSSNNLKIKQ